MRWVAALLLFVANAQAQEASTAHAVPESAATSYRLGVITAITVPQPLSIGLLAVPSYDPDLAFFVEGGYFRFGFGNNRTISDWSLMTGVRYHPYSNWFFCALELGFRHVGLNADISSLQSEGTPLASSASLSLKALFFGLIVGGQWKLSENVSLGLDMGLQLPFVHWGDVSIVQDPNTTDGTDLSVDASDSMGRVAGLPLPQIALLRFIWYI